MGFGIRSGRAHFDCRMDEPAAATGDKALSVLEWPGNVRELENRIKRAVIMAEGGSVSQEDLELVSPYAEYGMGLVKASEAIEKELIEKALARNKGNLTRAAAELGINRPTLYELIEKLGIIRK